MLLLKAASIPEMERGARAVGGLGALSRSYKDARPTGSRLPGPRAFIGSRSAPCWWRRSSGCPSARSSSILPTPGTVSPRLARQTPLGPSSTTEPPLTSRTVQPSMVAGLVSGTGVGRLEPFGFSATAAGGAAAFCFAGAVSWARPVAAGGGRRSVAGPFISRRMGSGASAGGPACLTSSGTGSPRRAPQLEPPIHPRLRPRNSNAAPARIAVGRSPRFRAGMLEAVTRSRSSILIWWSHASDSVPVHPTDPDCLTRWSPRDLRRRGSPVSRRYRQLLVVSSSMSPSCVVRSPAQCPSE